MRYIFILLLALLITSCKKDQEVEEDTLIGYDYYPLEDGRYIDYSVHQISYAGTITDTTYDVRDVLEFNDESFGETRYYLYRYSKQRSATEYPVQPDSIWTIIRTGTQLTRQQSNVKLVPLIFPPKINSSWDKNVFNTLEDDFVSIIRSGVSWEGAGLQFNDVVLVEEQADTTNLIERDLRFTVYERGIGPSYILKEQYSYDQSSLGLFEIEFGEYAEYKRVGYGTR
jgi:hypothetical protein